MILAFPQSISIQVANGHIIDCTHQLPDQMWGLQGYSFTTTFKIMPLQSYDIILGMDWLSLYNPMHFHWTEKWLQFKQDNQLIKLQGILPGPRLGLLVSSSQLSAMDKTASILYAVQVNTVDPPLLLRKDSPIPPEIAQLIETYSAVFKPPEGLPPSRTRDHSIPLLPGAQPFSLRSYRYNPAQKSKIEAQIKDMLDKGWIQNSSSPFSSPTLLVHKKTGDWRFCVDYRRLNAQTVKNKYPLPLIEDLLDELHGATWFTSLYLCSGFHQIRMK